MTPDKLDETIAKKLGYNKKEESGYPCTIPLYHCDLNAWIGFMEKLPLARLTHDEDGWTFRFGYQHGNFIREFEGQAKKAALAICRAVLKLP